MVTILDEATKENSCLGCAGHCCWENLINLCGYDVWATAKELCLKPADFVASSAVVTG